MHHRIVPPPQSAFDSSYIITECRFLSPCHIHCLPSQRPLPRHSLPPKCPGAKTLLCPATGPANSIGQRVTELGSSQQCSTQIVLYVCSCNQQWINHERLSVSVTVPRCWDFAPFKLQVIVAAVQFGRADKNKAWSQFPISLVFNWHLLLFVSFPEHQLIYFEITPLFIKKRSDSTKYFFERKLKMLKSWSWTIYIRDDTASLWIQMDVSVR